MTEWFKEKMKVYANLDNYSDIEGKGLYPRIHDINDIHCIASLVEDPETNEDVMLLFHDNPEYDNVKVWDEHDKKEYTIPERAGNLLEGFRYWYMIGQSEKGILHIQNCHGYDKPVTEKVVAKCKIPFHKWRDSFIDSKLQWQDRPTPKGAKGQHGLAAYGIRAGVKKPDITEWETMDAYKLHRVLEDVKIQKYTTKYLKKENDLLENLGIDLTAARKMDSEYQETCFEQEVYGAKVDKDHILSCIEDLDKKIEELAQEIEPKLPMTCKVSGGKVSRVEMAALFGYDTSKMKDQMEKVKRDGEMVTVPVKPYYKPTMNFHTTDKANAYSAFNISYGESPVFRKKNDLTKWIKGQHPLGDKAKAKDLTSFVKEWEIEKNIEETKLLNKNTCDYFEVNPEDTNIVVGSHTKLKWVESKLTQHEVVKSMLIKEGITYAEEWNLKKDENNQVIKAEFDTEVRYPEKARPDLQMVLKIKKGEALVTSPKFGEKEYEQLESEDGKKVGLYNTLVHRRRFLSNPKDPENKGLLSAIREDGRIPCGVNVSSTGTLRSSHKIWVNAPSESAVYGEQIRKCIVADEGKKLVSHDMNSAQLSIAAYYANNYDYFKAVCYGQETKLDDEGNDILHPDTGLPWYIGESGHCTNMQAFGLVSSDEVVKAIETQDQKLIKSIGLRRKKSKGATFGVIFGCSGKKLALMLGIDEAEGNMRKNRFLEQIGLDRPIQILDAMCEKNKRGRGGYIELPFGYYAYCSSPHARFNYLDQGTEAACQKWAELYFHKEAKRLGLPANRILSYHK